MFIVGQSARSTLNYSSGCKTAVSNVVMSIVVMITSLLLAPLFHHTPLVILSAIITSAVLSLIDYKEALRGCKMDNFDFVVCMNASIGVVFASIEIRLLIAVCYNPNLSLVFFFEC